MKNNKIQKLKKILSKNLKVSIEEIKINNSYKDYTKWDSLNNVKIYLDIKKEFKKNIEMSKYMSCKKINDILNII
tara:strand:- start:455 stop:679 length:225 start_codon:yes stop_codon:yes gene_type:complete